MTPSYFKCTNQPTVIMSYERYRQSLRKLELLETQLKTLIVEEKIKQAINNKCLICMETMDIYIKPPCQHYVCKDCYERSLDSVNGNKCCMCRRPIVTR